MQLDFSSRQGHITLYLPSEFEGHVQCETEQGKVTFSDRVSQNLTRFSNHNGKHFAFLSPTPIPSGPEGATAFDDAPDNLVAKTALGNIKISYLEEDPEGPGADGGRKLKTGWFGWLSFT
jgi:hypothetical protein